MNGFSHPVGLVILEQLVEVERSTFGFDEGGQRRILDEVKDAFAQDPNGVATALVEVMNFLVLQGGDRASDFVMDVFLSLGALADQLGVKGSVLNDALESLGRRTKARSILGFNPAPKVAPRADAKRPAGTLRVADLMPQVRRR